MNAAASITRPSLRALVQSADCCLPGTIGMKMALVALTRLFDDRTGLCRGSNRTIGALMSCSADQAKRYLAALCALRVGAQALVSKLPCPGRSTAYVIHLDVLAALGDCKPLREAVDNSDSTPFTPGMETVNPLQIRPLPLAPMPPVRKGTELVRRKVRKRAPAKRWTTRPFPPSRFLKT